MNAVPKFEISGMATVLLYWRSCDARGDRPKPIFAAVDTVKKEIKSWSLSRRQMTTWIASLVSPDLYVVVKIDRCV